MILKLTFVLLLVLASLADEIHLDGIEVIGRSIETDIRESAETVTVINVDTLRGRAMTIEDIVNKASGVKILSAGGVGSSSRAMIRGLDGKRVRIFINGSPVDSPEGTFSINDIPIDLIQRIEIYKGIVPARFGGDGIGGAINIVPISVTSDYLDISYSLSSHSTHRISAVGRKNFEELGWHPAVGVIFNYSKNDYTFQSPHYEGLSITRDHDRFSSVAVAFPQTFTKLWFDEVVIDPSFLLGINEMQGIEYNIKHAETQYMAGVLDVVLKKSSLFADNLDFDYCLAIPYGKLSFIDTSHYSYDFFGDSIPSPGGQGEVNFNPNHSDDRLFEVRQRLNMNYFFSESHNLNFNLAYRYASKTFSDPLADSHAGFTTTPLPGKLNSAVTGLTYEFNSPSKRFMNIFSAKFYAFSSIVSEKHSAPVSSGDLSGDEYSNFDFGFSEAVRWRLSEGINVKASYQHALRLPTPDEVFGNGVVIKRSLTLVPEKSHNLNIGVQFDTQKKIDWLRVQFEANSFFLSLKNMIALIPSTPYSKHSNYGEVSIRGFDTELKLNFFEKISLYGNATYQYSVDELEHFMGTQSPNPTKGMQIPNIPIFFCNTGVDLHTNNLFGLLGEKQTSSFFWDLQFIDEYFYEFEMTSNQNRRVPRSLVQNMGIQQSFNHNRFMLSAEIHNLTDEPVINLFEKPLSGRTFALKFRFSLVDLDN